MLSAFSVSDGVTAQIKIFDGLDGKKPKMSGTEQMSPPVDVPNDLISCGLAVAVRPTLGRFSTPDREDPR